MLPASGMLLAALAAGCLDNPGNEPPAGALYFPIAMDLHGDHVYVASANFDLRYNAGTMHSFNLDALAACAAECHIDDDCVVVPVEADTAAADRLVLDALPCQGLQRGEVLLGSFASDLQVAPGGERVYLSIRSESNLTHVHTDANGRLACGGEPGVRHRCDDAFRFADDDVASARGVNLPLDPVGIHVGELDELIPSAEGDFVLMAHRSGAASLFVEVGGRPALADVLGGLPLGLENLPWHGRTGLAWLPSSAEPRIGRVAVAADAADPLGSRLLDAGGLVVAGVDPGGTGTVDTRDVAFDPRPDVRRAYVMARRPPALLVLDLGEADEIVELREIIPLCPGPSRMKVATVVGRLVAFVTCFNSRNVYTVDLDRGMLLDVTSAGGGPFVLSVDEDRGLLLISDFTNSVLRVHTLEPLVDCLEGRPVSLCAPEPLAVLGIPRPVQELR
jgi:hypothetical protein